MATWWSAPTPHHAFILSWISVLVTVCAAGTGIAIAAINGSSLMLCFGLENCVDFLSSCVVLWRFYCPHEDAELEKRLARREKRASIAISFILGLLGFGIMFAAIDDIVGGAEDQEKLRAVLIVSLVSFVVFGLLTVIKFHYSGMLQSASLHKDGICSLIGTVLSAALFFNTLIIDSYPQAWWMDPVVALLCAVAAIFIGLYALVVAACVQGLPIWTCRWWYSSQGDGMDEITGRKLGPEDFPTEDVVEHTEVAGANGGTTQAESELL